MKEIPQRHKTNDRDGRAIARPYTAAEQPARVPARGASPSAATWAVCGLLVLAVIVVFAQTAGHEFVNLDDNEYVYENWLVQRGLTAGSAAWAITAFHALNWHPLTWLSHMLDCQFYGLNPAGHHMTSVLLHAAAAVVLFLALRRLTQSLWPSALAAALFAIHPLRVESVAWVAERKDVLSGLLFALTLYLHAFYAERPASWGRYLALTATFAVGLTAKPMLMSLPLVLLLLDYWPGSREQKAWSQRGLQTLLAEKIPLFLLSAASCLVTFAAQRSAIHTFDERNFTTRVANALVVYVAYLGKMVWPTDLAAYYPLPQALPTAGAVIAAAFVLLTISAVCFAARRSRPYLLVGWLWYLVMLVPVIGLVQVGSQAMADRYTYLPQIGLSIALAWGAADLLGALSYRNVAAAMAAALILAALTVCAWQQTQHWRNGETLWTHTLACTSDNAFAENNLALVLARSGRSGEAIAHYAEALRINPDLAEVRNNFGRVLADRGQTDEAIKQYQRALKIKPNCAEAYFNLGSAYTGRKQLPQAIAEYQAALKIKPDYVDAIVNLGNDLAEAGQIDDAIANYRKALEIRPDFADAHYNLANALAARGALDDAIAHYQAAVRIRPDSLEAQFNLAVVLDGRGQRGEALAHYRSALMLAAARNDRERAEWLRAKIESLPANGRKVRQNEPK